MRKLTSHGEQAVADLAARYGVSTDAVRTLLEAVLRGKGTMAQFSHPELGGSGQWMAGGMTMVGDMFNHRLQAVVSGLATELSGLLASGPVFEATAAATAPPGRVHPANLDSWWPEDLGQPSSSGGQNDARYAVFPRARRLAVQSGGGPVRVYDMGDHVISGVQQQQGALPGTLQFTSQHGTFAVDSLPPVGPAPTPGPTAADPAPAGTATDAVLAALDRLGDLHRRGVLSDAEFAAKKAEMLARL